MQAISLFLFMAEAALMIPVGSSDYKKHTVQKKGDYPTFKEIF